jgi:hypothetical protein
MVMQPRLLGGVAACVLGAVMFVGNLPHHGVTIEPFLLVAIGLGLIALSRGGRETMAWRRGQFFMNLGAGERARKIETQAEYAEAAGAILLLAAMACWITGIGGRIGWLWVGLAGIGLALASLREIAVATGLSKEPKKRPRPNLRIVN